MATRQEVFTAIDSERDYQNSVWGEGHDLALRRPEEWLVYLKVYLDKAFVVMTSEPDETAFPETTHILRKIAALSIAAMEQLGAPQRVGFERPVTKNEELWGV